MKVLSPDRYPNDCDIGQNYYFFYLTLTLYDIPCLGSYDGNICPRPFATGDRCYI